MGNDEGLDLAKVLRIAASQAKAFNKRERSRAAIDYGTVMSRSAAILREYTETSSFEELLMAEKVFQQNDQNIYAKVPSTLQAVQKGAHPVSSGMCTSRSLSVRPIPPISVSLHAVTLS